jgi:serine/threonine protein kinase
LYIIQDKAIGDIEAIRSKEPLTITEEYLKKIKSRCLSIALGLYVLHNDDIIHADVKASNALVFLNGDKEIVKLCDFSISVKKWKKNSFFRHEVGTMTHRAPENLIKDKWNEKLDIWALACTFYEIAYGKKLFKYQGENIKDMDIVRKKTYNSILDWGSQNGQIAPENSYQNVDFTRSKYCREWRNPLMASFNDLLSNMLKINSKYRCNINEVLSHPFFDYKGSKTYFCYDNSSLQEDIDSDIAKYGDLDENVKRLCLELYQKSYNLDIDKKDKIETCIYVACKLTYNTKIEICKEIRKREDITALEIKLCQSLRFILHGVI